ncbi:MAG: ATP-binding protein [Marinisporobacter sp.]|jgi:ATP-dependent DNA helicase RecG|nr:ATP-binding protein [Marinisporobacter sp.]
MLELFIQGETKYIEYKKEYTKTLLKTISAFANYHDGYIIIGIDDFGNIIGVDNSDSVRLSIENAVNDNIIPKPYYEIECRKRNGKYVVIVKVFKGDNTPIQSITKHTREWTHQL